jgi:hypothetical protein
MYMEAAASWLVPRRQMTIIETAFHTLPREFVEQFDSEGLVQESRMSITPL